VKLNLHTKAVEAAIAAAGKGLTDKDAPLLELARALARQMDAAGPSGAGTRLTSSYLTVIRALTARLAELDEPPAVVGNLARLRADHERLMGSRRRRA